jgi:hypothetical protein
MKRFLLALGILLCMQCCTFARNLREFGEGYYVDLDSFRVKDNYGYALIESHSNNINLDFVLQFDLLNYKYRTIKSYALDYNGRVIAILEEFDMPQDFIEWRKIPENSICSIMFKMLKNLVPINDIK